MVVFRVHGSFEPASIKEYAVLSIVWLRSPASGDVDEIDHVENDTGTAIIQNRDSIHIATLAIWGRGR